MVIGGLSPISASRQIREAMERQGRLRECNRAEERAQKPGESWKLAQLSSHPLNVLPLAIYFELTFS